MTEHEPVAEPDALVQMLIWQWKQIGKPSLRTISNWTLGAVSHTTVSSVLNGRGTHRWHTVEKVAEALGCNVERVRQAWLADQEGDRPQPLQADAVLALAEAVNNLADAIRSIPR